MGKSVLIAFIKKPSNLVEGFCSLDRIVFSDSLWKRPSWVPYK